MRVSLLHNREDWAGSVRILGGRENLELGTQRSFRGGKHHPWAGRVPGRCPWQHPWLQKRRSGQRPGGGRGCWCCGSGLAAPLTAAASPAPQHPLCGLAHRHPEAGEWAARERPQGASPAGAGPRPALAPAERPRVPSGCPLHVALAVHASASCPHLSRAPCAPLNPSIPLQAGFAAPAVRGGSGPGFSGRGSSFQVVFGWGGRCSSRLKA